MFPTEPLCLPFLVAARSMRASSAFARADLRVHFTPVTTVGADPLPFEPRTLTEITHAFLAAQYLAEAMVPAQRVP